MRKKTEDEKKEDEEIQKAVNATLEAEEEKRRQEEKKKEDEAKKKKNGTDKKESGEKKKDVGSQDEACPPANSSCPTVKPCSPCHKCPELVEKDCPPMKECPAQEVCPEVEPCMPCGPCPPIHCQPCPVANCTSVDNTAKIPQECPNPVEVTMPLPVAIAVGATLGALVTGVAAGIGLLLRYASPIESGILFVATIIVVWYLCSHHPEAAREIGGRAVAILREATLALSTRVMAALQRQQEQVGVPMLGLISSKV